MVKPRERPGTGITVHAETVMLTRPSNTRPTPEVLKAKTEAKASHFQAKVKASHFTIKSGLENGFEKTVLGF